MDDRRKNAYRYVVYWAMLEIRPLHWVIKPPWRLLNPLRAYRVWRKAQYAGLVAEWLHNVAHFSSFDFDQFDEARFCQEYEYLLKRFPEASIYRRVFDRE